jgi:hypothetical protein
MVALVTLVRATPAVALFLSIVDAQQQEPDPRLQRLQRALGKTAELQAIAATVKTTETGPLTAAMRGNAAATPDVEVITAAGKLYAKLGDDEVVEDGRRSVARKSGGEWKPRLRRLADGRDVPFVFDPLRLCAALNHDKLQVAHAEVGAWNDLPIEIFSVRVEGDAARDLLFAGLVPQPVSGFRVVAFPGANMPAPRPELVVDLAFFVEPSSGTIHRVRLRVVDSSQAAAGGAAVFVAGGAVVRQVGQQEEEEEAEAGEETPAAAPAYKDGLPVRKKTKKNQNEPVTVLEATLKEHGTAKLPEK